MKPFCSSTSADEASELNRIIGFCLSQPNALFLRGAPSRDRPVIVLTSSITRIKAFSAASMLVPIKIAAHPFDFMMETVRIVTSRSRGCQNLQLLDGGL